MFGTDVSTDSFTRLVTVMLTGYGLDDGTQVSLDLTNRRKNSLGWEAFEKGGITSRTARLSAEPAGMIPALKTVWLVESYAINVVFWPVGNL